MSIPRHRAGKVLVNEAQLIMRMLTSLATIGSSDTQLPGIVLGVTSNSSFRFLFDEADLLLDAAVPTGAGAIMAAVLVLMGVDAIEAAIMDILTVGRYLCMTCLN